MEKLKIKWNTIYFEDCIEGMKKLPDKCVDIVITDPPFNINYNTKKGMYHKGRYCDFSDNIEYKDSLDIDNYKTWCKKWFGECKRISNVVIIYCGIMNLNMWIEIENPYGFAFHTLKNAKGGSKGAYANCVRPILIYNKNKNRLNSDLFEYNAQWGFLRKETYLHPCPLNFNFWYDLINQLRPESVCDPFVGSGTTAQVCTILNIPYIGFEINEAYKPDIDFRLSQKELRRVNPNKNRRLDEWF